MELYEDIKTAVHENLEQFNAKLSMQQTELEDLQLMIHDTSDCIADLVTSSPHDSIRDPVSTRDHCRAPLRLITLL